MPGRILSQMTTSMDAQASPAPDPDGGSGDVHELLVAAVEEAARLLDADGAMVYLVDETTGHLRFAHDAGIRDAASRRRVQTIDLPVGVGMFGRAVAQRSVILTRDYPEDDSFPHAADTDRVVRDVGIRSMVVAPLLAGDAVFGAIGTYSPKPDAFSDADIALVRALADHAAAAMANARLIEDLDASRRELAERADVERSVREIAARISAATDLSAVLQLAVDEAARLLRSEGARIDMIDGATGLLRLAYASGGSRPDDSPLPDDPEESADQGVSGQAVLTGRPYWTGDYVADERFPHGRGADDYLQLAGIRSVMAAPLSAKGGPIGTLSVFASRPDAWAEADSRVLAAIADQAAITIRTTRLIDETDRARETQARRAEAEQALREVGARITAMRETDEILRDVVRLAGRLVRADGVILDLLDPSTGNLQWAMDDGLSEDFDADERAALWISVGVGATGMALAEDRVVIADDDLASLFPASAESTEFYARTGFRSMVAAPITGDKGPLGVLEVYSRQPAAFGETDAGFVGALAGQAAIAITNARLIEELDRSRRALAGRAETERALREIAAGIAALRDPDVILDRVVGEARRLLATDGAHLTRMSDDRTYLIPVIATDGTDDETRAWLLGMQFPLGGGINGLAAERDEAVWTGDYETDPRVPHDGSDDEVARRLGLCGMAAAPLRAPGGEVIGTLAISSATPRDFDAEELDLLQGLADQAAIAITNSTLLARLSESEARYRFLIENAPDVVFSTQADGRYTFVSDAIERLTGHRPDDVVGRRFGWLFHESSQDIAGSDWSAGMSAEAPEIRRRVDLRARDGSPVPAEFIASARFDEAGRFAGTNGSVRDMRERDRLEDELRASEVRFRTLAASSPDLVFETDAEGHWTFLSDRTTDMLGWSIDEMIGQHFSGYIAPGYEDLAAARYADLAESPNDVLTVHLNFRAADGRSVPLEINVVGSMKDGRLAAIHGVGRDVSERDRLERDLRRQAAELAAGEERAHLARELHDSVTQALFSMTLVSRSIEMLLDRDVDAAKSQMTQLRDLQREALAEMRALIFELRPGNLEQDGLDRALRTHAAALQGRIGLPITVESALDDRLPLAIEEVLYRIAQEALHNVVKHANARQVRVELGRITGAVRLRVSDDGRGFDPTQVGGGHLGLAGMQARADKIEARFTVTSVAGAGTAVDVVVPNEAIKAAAVAPVRPARDSIRDE